MLNRHRADNDPFHVIDLDPYGTAVPFLESTLGAIANHGMINVTFTDLAVLCDRAPQVCFYRYGSAPLGKANCHEFALRMVLYTINSIANKMGKQIEPLLSLSVDFYIRLFIRVRNSPQQCHSSLSRYSQVFQCQDCEAFYLQRLGNLID